MKRIVPPIVVAAALLIPRYGSATVYELPVQPEAAEGFLHWCYAAGMLALLNRYDIYPGVTEETGLTGKGQCLIADKVLENEKAKYGNCLAD